MGLCVMLLAGGCTKNGAAGNLSNNVSPTESATDATVSGAPAEVAPVREAYKVADYIKLGKYKGIAVTVEKLTVSDADVEAKIQSELVSNTTTEEVTDRKVVKDGDIVNIDYEGLKDGVAFEGGTAKGSDLTIGSGQFIEGFEEGLIGKNVGDKVELNLTFPEDYTDGSGNKSDLAGQAVVFNVTINSIKKSVTPKLTEAYVKEKTDYDSINAYRKATRESLEATNQETMDNNKTNSVITALIDESTITSYPQTLIDYYSYSYESYISQMLYYYYNTTIEDYIKAQGQTQEDFDANVKTVAENYAALEMVERAIAEAENIKVTDDEYATALKKYMTDYSKTTEEDLYKTITKEEITDELLLKKALDVAVENAVVTETEATPTPAAATLTPAAK